MFKPILLSAALLIGGCASIDNSTVSKVQKALDYAKGVYAFSEIALAKYDARKPCGEPTSPRICRDLNVSQKAAKIMASAKIILNDTQANLNLAVATGKIDEAVITSALLTVITDALAIVDLFEVQQ